MHAATDRLEFSPPPTRGLLRALGLALLAHAFLLAALTWGVHWKSEAVTVTAEAELWSAVPQQAAPKRVELPPEPQEPPPPVKAPPPAPVPAQPLLPDADIAVEREKLQLEKKRLQDKRDQEKKAAQDKKKLEQDAKRKDALKAQDEAKKLAALRDKNLKRIAELAGATGAADSSGTALHSSGPSPSYAGRVSAKIKPNIVFVDAIAGNPMAKVDVRTAPDGTIISRTLSKSSGVKSWDDAVLKAIDKTEKLPPDVDSRVPLNLEISFRPKD